MSTHKGQKEIIRKEIKKELARRSYADYCIYSHEGRWILGKHLKYICSKVEDLIYRRIKQNILIISMPPQHGKSQAVTETLPSWYLGKWPHKRVIEVSYGDDLARRFGRRNKQKINDFGKELFNIELAANSRSDTEFEIAEHKGSMISRGIMAGITGQPGDLIIIDDPIKNKQEAESETYRERIWEEFLNSILTRLSADGIIILIMTRWHEDDLAGRILTNMPDKALEINIPLEAEENDILGREVGDPLFPEIGKDKQWLEDFKQNYQTQEGTRAWMALMQGRPTAQEGNLIKRSWWKYYEQLPQITYKIISVDATFKNLEDNDFVVIQAWGKAGPNYYLVDQVRARMSFTETLKALRAFNSKHKSRIAIYIEDKANGSAIIDVLSQKISGIIAYQPKDSKVVRAQSVMPLIEAGNVYLPKYAAFTNDFVEECASFPNGANDDQVDGLSMGLTMLKQFIDIPQTPQQDNQFSFTNEPERSDLALW
jgi:predicted phage terminase large subunit-like protein